MAEIVNLNQFRKSKRRAEDRKAAKNNRIKYGRTKSEQKAAKADEAARIRELDGKKAERPPED